MLLKFTWCRIVYACSVAQLCPALCDPKDSSPPGSSVHGIFQARILEWVAISSSRGSSPPRNQTHFSFISCICRQILYRWATWEAFYCSSDTIKYVQTVLILLLALLWRNGSLGPLPYSSPKGGVQTPVTTTSGSEPVCSRYPSVSRRLPMIHILRWFPKT